MPIAWKDALAHYAGRLHRLRHAKREVVIYDYVDDDAPVIARMAAKRRSAYQALGYRVGADTELDLGQPMPILERLPSEMRLVQVSGGLEGWRAAFSSAPRRLRHIRARKEKPRPSRTARAAR